MPLVKKSSFVNHQSEIKRLTYWHWTEDWEPKTEDWRLMTENQCWMLS